MVTHTLTRLKEIRERFKAGKDCDDDVLPLLSALETALEALDFYGKAKFSGEKPMYPKATDALAKIEAIMKGNNE